MEIKVKTLKDKEYKQRINDKKDFYKWGILYSQQCNGFQLYLPNEDYYVEVSSPLRGASVKKNDGNFVFDVASNPQSPDDLRDAFIAIIRDKCSCEIQAANDMAKILKEEKGIEIDLISNDDI